MTELNETNGVRSWSNIKALRDFRGTSLVVQWLRLHAPNTGGLGSIPGQGTKIPHASTKPQHSQINKKNFFKG